MGVWILQHLDAHRGWGTRRELALPNSLFRVSLVDKVELRVVHQLNGWMNRWEGGALIYEGTSDVQIGTKIQLWQREGSRMEVAYLGHAVLPTGDAEVTGGLGYGMVNKLCISHDVGPDWALGYNLGYDLADEQGIFTYALAIGKAINDPLGVYFEPYGEMANGVHFASLDAGLTQLSSDQWQWDLSYGTGLNHRMNYTAIGFSWLVLPIR